MKKAGKPKDSGTRLPTNYREWVSDCIPLFRKPEISPSALHSELYSVFRDSMMAHEKLCCAWERCRAALESWGGSQGFQFGHWFMMRCREGSPPLLLFPITGYHDEHWTIVGVAGFPMDADVKKNDRPQTKIWVKKPQGLHVSIPMSDAAEIKNSGTVGISFSFADAFRQEGHVIVPLSDDDFSFMKKDRLFDARVRRTGMEMIGEALGQLSFL